MLPADTLPQLTAGDTERLCELQHSGRHVFGNLPGSAASFLAIRFYQITQKPMVWITDGPNTLEELFRDVEALLGGGHEQLCVYPPLEHHPGAHHIVHPTLVGDRLKALNRWSDQTPPGITLTCVQALLQTAPSPEQVYNSHKTLRCGDVLSPEHLSEWLVDHGYQLEAEVNSPGEAARRGGLIDVWPPGEHQPIRVEFFGNEIDTLRSFDAIEQRSKSPLPSCVLTPASEPENQKSWFTDHLNPQAGFALIDPPAVQDHARLHQEAVVETSTKRARSWRALLTRLRKLDGPEWRVQPDHTNSLIPFVPVERLPALSKDSSGLDAIEKLRREWIERLVRQAETGESVHLFFSFESGRERFIETYRPFLKTIDQLHIHTQSLAEGFLYPDGQLTVITEADLYGHPRRVRPRVRPRTQTAKETTAARFSTWADIQPGEFVVHADHGIGRYLGIYEVDMEGGRAEALAVEYAGQSKLYLPVNQAHLLSKYVGAGSTTPELHALGGGRWKKQKEAAHRAIRDLAASMLETQAARDALQGHAFEPDTPWQREFESAFPYVETPDQTAASLAIKTDMEQTRPMDRLLCGDVGYGKTEVAMRAAFKAVMGGKQVAVLVPTTVLAQQHYETFRQRMAAFPVRIEMLSRFCTRGEQADTIQRMRTGACDIVIGTHRLAQGDIAFKDLGLVIIDEEQRFGVGHKEKLKQLRRLVDVLTLTATPIPRTLYLSLTGARDMSTIQTPPRERLPVETIITEAKDGLVRQAILNELDREGQVFYLHNRVHSIGQRAEQLRSLVPEARIEIGHGQMSERALADVMQRFARREVDLLLCTTIIESGVDMPNVNTILIDRADRFGLADLYQLRGRVGRYRHQAYAYLLLPRHARLLHAARQRMQAIRRYSSLGAGFKLALRDLELRGAGNLLGARQSGHIAAVGFDLYCQLLERTVAALKGLPMAELVTVDVRIDFMDSAPSAQDEARAVVIPYAYIEDENQRFQMYRKLAAITTPEDIDELRDEFKDRFGPPPTALDRLLKLALVRLRAGRQHIDRIEVKDRVVRMFRGTEPVKSGTHFPRLTATDVDEQLDELMALCQRIV